MSEFIPESELIINADGSIYHLNLLPGDIAHHIITVGDPDRVDAVASRLDNIKLTKQKREFKTITGDINGKPVTIISTGIGTDNIDIVFTELDALVNVDFQNRKKHDQHTTLYFYRIGTSGALLKEVDLDSCIISRYAIGLESLMHYYNYSPDDSTCSEINESASSIIKQSLPNISPYTVSASPVLTERYSALGREGITVTATGFYGPQGRTVLAKPRDTEFLDNISKIKTNHLSTTNLEMETAGIYGMASLLGHHAISLNAILANRPSRKFSSQPAQTVENLIDSFFEIFKVS